MREKQEKMMIKIKEMLTEGKLLSSVIFDESEVMTILYEGHIWFARIMNNLAYDLVDLQNENHIKPVIDYTEGKRRSLLTMLLEEQKNSKAKEE